LVLSSGCLGPSIRYTVDPDDLKEMSRQGQLWIYDAENEIMVALDKLDEVRDTLATTERRIAMAEIRIRAAEKRKSQLGIQVAEAWHEHLERMQQWAQENIHLHRLGVVVAKASVELARAQIIDKEDLLSGKSFSIADFQEQHESLKREFEQQGEQVHTLRKRARKQEQAWWALRKSYTAKTGDYDSGLWIE